MLTFRNLAVALCAAALLCVAQQPSTARAATTHFDRVFLVMMENQGFDDVIGHADANGNPDTPYITQLAYTYGLATWAFGVTHPSLPNYLSIAGGYTNNISDDNPSCYAQPGPPQPGCHSIPYKNIVDEFEAANISWNVFEQTMPSPGYLGAQYPTNPNGPVLYAQKHNPFVYYTDIATNARRLSHILPLDNNASQLASALSHGAQSPRFVMVVPDQCHDMHGTSTCTNYDALLRTGDAYVQTVVRTIVHSSAYTQNSAIFITWDENDYSSSIGCCQSLVGGGHIATLVVTPRYGSRGIEMALPSNHYNLLATIQDGLGIPRLVKSIGVPPTYFTLTP